MKKEQIVTTTVMLVISVVLLIGFTIAWYTSDHSTAGTKGMKLEAAGSSEFKIALEPGGTDIGELPEDKAEVSVTVQPENSLVAPGSSGKITFYITPKGSQVTSCTIETAIQLQERGNDSLWYPDATLEDPASALSNDQKAMVEIATGHIEFYHDELLTNKVTPDNPLKITWSAGDQSEKQADIYWKWHYNTPDETKKSVEAYDAEDFQFGQKIKSIRFWFQFIKG